MSGLLNRLGAQCAARKLVVLAAWAVVLVLVAGAWVHRHNRNSTSPIVFHVAWGRLTSGARRRAVQASLDRRARVQSPYGTAAAAATGR